MGICGSCSHVRQIEQFYQLDSKPIGHGSHATVYRGTDKQTEEFVAVKLIPKKYVSQELNIDQEIRTMWKCADHPNVITIHEVFETPEYVKIVMDLAEGGELFKKLIHEGAYSEVEARQHIRELLTGLKYLHSKGIVHRALKPENLLLTTNGPDAVLRIADFGMSVIAPKNTIITSPSGAWAYSAPEVLNLEISMMDENSTDKKGYDSKCDMWSAGILMCVLLSGMHPFDLTGRQTQKQMKEQIRNGSLQMDQPVWESISIEAKDLIRKLLSINPEDRPSAEEALNSRWFHNFHLSKRPLSLSIHSDLGHYQSRMKTKLRASVYAVVAASKYKNHMMKDIHHDSIESIVHTFEANSSEEKETNSTVDTSHVTIQSIEE